MSDNISMFAARVYVTYTDRLGYTNHKALNVIWAVDCPASQQVSGWEPNIDLNSTLRARLNLPDDAVINVTDKALFDGPHIETLASSLFHDPSKSEIFNGKGEGVRS